MEKCSSKKNQSCRRKTVLILKVVCIGFVNTTSVHYVQQFSDKYPIYTNFLTFKIVENYSDGSHACQSCVVSISPQSFPQTVYYHPKLVQKHYKVIKFFPKLLEISQDLASPPLINILLRNYTNYPIPINVHITFKTVKRFKFSKLLRCGDVEANPGPPSNKQSLSIITYNSRGLKDRNKLKRLLNTCHRTLSQNKNSIAFLQETHLEEDDRKAVEMMWRHNFVISPGTNRQCGCLILFDSSWEIIKYTSDNEGRLALVVLKKMEKYYVCANIYAPNDHDLNFFTRIFNVLIEFQTEFPGSNIILAGDFNLVLDDNNDAVHRNSTNTERQSRTLIKRNLIRLNLIDSYRKMNCSGGYTWKRGNCMSRLDMIFTSKEISKNIVNSTLDWSFDDSDHAMVGANFLIPTTFDRGPGLIKVNVDILDDDTILEEVKSELSEQLAQIPEHWNPHVKLDFVKTSLRSIIAYKSGKKKRVDRLDQEAIAEQLNKLINTKELLERGELVNPELLVSVNEAINSLEAENKRHLDQLGKKLCVRAQAKWYEEGERSNKYFLNIIKKRGEQKLITNLKTQNESFETQEEIMEHVTNFYKNLYDEKSTNDNYDELLSDLPRLNAQEKALLDRPITLDELKTVLDGCKESAPGPDGISYKVYKKLWTQTGPFLLDAWKYSNSIGILPLDQRISAITLLPKVGKSLDRIENWRPITLSNCDLKIFTKLISNRVSKVLDKLIHPAQTAYVPGRIVQDNLRMFDFYNNYCKENNIDALLISLDAKKAFDSVSHKYLHKILSAYGFSEDFIDTVKLLYKDIKANILVNGYKSVMINILRSVKQGDALSCALFILCIDPLIRKIESNPEIKPVQIPRSRITGIKISSKVGGFADDVGMVVNNDPSTINNIFNDYATFTGLSGIELNIDKTEIMEMKVNSIHSEFSPTPISVGQSVVDTVESITICGICFSNNSNKAYETNILDKIIKMEKQLIRWLQRPLSIEGKILIVKTFGLSQLIYVMQMCEIREAELIDIERTIFKFLWNKKWVGNQAPDRIKRATLKLPYDKGGLQAPDIKDMDKALKTRQFVRAMKAKHPVNLIQKFQLERIGYDDYHKIEYAKFCQKDIVIKVYQLTCNKLTDYFRSHCSVLPLPNPESRIDVINVIASTDVLEYLMRNKELLIINRFATLANLGIISYKQLYNESIYPRSDEFGELARYIMQFFPNSWSTAMALGIEINSEITYSDEFPSQQLRLCSHEFITVKSIKKTFKEGEVTPTHPYTLAEKFQLTEINNSVNPFVNIRKFIHAPRDKFFKYRILQGDVFCKARMFKFKLVDSQFCDFCANQEVETIKHMLWDCPRAQYIWSYLRQLTNQVFNLDYITYESVIVGSENSIPLIEVLIVLALKVICVKNRSEIASREQYVSKIRSQYIVEKIAMKNNVDKFNKKWQNIALALLNGFD